MSSSYDESRRNESDRWLSRRTEQLTLSLSLELGLVAAAVACLIFLQWLRITDDDSISGFPRLFFDGVRYMLAFGIFAGSFLVWPILRNTSAHTNSLALFSESTKRFEEATRDRAFGDTDWLYSVTYQELDAVLTRAVTLLRIDVGGECRLTVKILLEAPENSVDKTPHVITLMRDHASREAGDRQGLGSSFPYTLDTALSSIITSNKSHFGANDLQALAERGQYQNANPHWRRLYNSTLVVPIRDAKSTDNSGLIGFLCIDSLDRNVDRDWIRRRLHSYASLIYDLFQVLYQFCAANVRRAAKNPDFEISHSDSTTKIGWEKTDDGNIEPVDLTMQRKMDIVLRRLSKMDDLDVCNLEPLPEVKTYVTVLEDAPCAEYRSFKSALFDLIGRAQKLGPDGENTLRMERRSNIRDTVTINLPQALAFGRSLGLIKDGRIIWSAKEPEASTLELEFAELQKKQSNLFIRSFEPA